MLHRRRKNDRPNEIMHAALILFIEHGIASVTVNRVAKESGASKGLVLRYFLNKSNLIDSVLNKYLPIYLLDNGLGIECRSGVDSELNLYSDTDFTIDKFLFLLKIQRFSLLNAQVFPCLKGVYYSCVLPCIKGLSDKLYGLNSKNLVSRKISPNDFYEHLVSLFCFISLYSNFQIDMPSELFPDRPEFILIDIFKNNLALLDVLICPDLDLA